MAQGLNLPATFQPTHETAGLPGYGAIDNFASGGTAVYATFDGTVKDVHMIPWNQQERVGGVTMYIQTKNGVYFLTHFGNVNVKDGEHIRSGQQIGTVAQVPQGWWQSHIHEGFHPGATSVPTDSSVPVTASQHAQSKAFAHHPGEGAGFKNIPSITDQGGFGPQGQDQQQGAFGLPPVSQLSPIQVANIWQEISSQQNSSPESRLLANNSSQITRGVPSFLNG